MRSAAIDGLRVLRLPTVYPPASDTDVLLGWLRDHGADGDVLELCAGTGVLALVAVRTAASVTAVDRCPWAAANIRLNAALNAADLEVHRGDLFGAVAGRRFDTIVANPPYMPTPASGGGLRSRAWDSGWDGREVLDRLAAQAASHLRPGGVVLIVQSAFADDRRTAALMAASGLAVTTLDQRTQPLGPVSRARTGHLAALGVLDPAAGVDELVLLQGRQP